MGASYTAIDFKNYRDVVQLLISAVPFLLMIIAIISVVIRSLKKRNQS